MGANTSILLRHSLAVLSSQPDVYVSYDERKNKNNKRSAHSSLFEAATTDAKVLEAHQYVGYEFVTGEEPSEAGPKQKKRRKPKGIIWYIDAEGNWHVLGPRDSIW